MVHYVVCIGVHNRRVLVHYKVDGPRGSLGLNGPGGKIEGDETSSEAAAREWDEEVYGVTQVSEWDEYAETRGEDWCIHFLKAIVNPVGDTILIDGLPATFIDPNFDLKKKISWGFLEMAREALEER